MASTAANLTAALVSMEFQEYRKGIGAVPAAEGI